MLRRRRRVFAETRRWLFAAVLALALVIELVLTRPQPNNDSCCHAAENANQGNCDRFGHPRRSHLDDSSLVTAFPCVLAALG
jgi:hypothetical protein